MNTQESIQEFQKFLEQYGVAEDLDWLSAILFVRNLVSHLHLFDPSDREDIQQFVLMEITKMDLGPEAFAKVTRRIEHFIAANRTTADLQNTLDQERRDTASLMAEMQALFDMLRGSHSRQENSLKTFGKRTVEAVENGTSKSGIIKQLRGMVTELVTEFREEARSWEERAKALEHNACHDPLLTELFNRRSFDDYLAEAVIESHSRTQPLSLIMLDVDNFKHVNDEFGHQAGDDLLRTLAKIIVSHVDIFSGYAARYGGEELMVVCPCGIKQALKIAEFIRRDVEKYEFITRINGQLSDRIHFTISLGVAELEPDWDADRIVEAADMAMLMAKRTGKNRVVEYKDEY